MCGGVFVTIFAPLFAALQNLFWLIPFMLIGSGIAQYLKPKIKGWFGERLVKSVIKRHGFECVDDAYLQDENDRLTQIDHAVLIAGHLVIIETKNYAGAIFGQAGEGRWTQKLGRFKFKFQNPIMQNKLHIRIAQDLFPRASIQSLICFVGEAEFPKGKPEGVVFLRELADTLKDYRSQALDPDQARSGLRAFVAIAQAQYVVDLKEIRKAHLQQLRERFGRGNTRSILAAVQIGLGLLIALGLLIFS